MRTGELMEDLDSMNSKGIEYAVMSCVRNFKRDIRKIVERGMSYEIFFNRRTVKKIINNKNRRRSRDGPEYETEKDAVKRDLRRFDNQIEKWRGLQNEYPGKVKVYVLGGSTKKRIECLLGSMGRGYNPDFRIIRKHYSPRYA
jgi:hypothetical protein